MADAICKKASTKWQDARARDTSQSGDKVQNVDGILGNCCCCCCCCDDVPCGAKPQRKKQKNEMEYIRRRERVSDQ